MRFDLGASTFLFGVSCWVLSLSLFASPPIMIAAGDAGEDTAELIRLHQKATALLYTYERETRGCELLDEEETSIHDGAGDQPMIRNASKRSKPIQV
jgi:hypothetical protein